MSRAKLSAEEKYSIVQKLSLGDVGISALASEYLVPIQTIYDWRDQYNLYGIEGLSKSNHWRSYSKELKENAVQDYLSGGYSQRNICKKYRVSRGAFRKWIKQYNSHKEFKNTHQGKSIMTTSRKLSFEEKIDAVHFCIKNNYDYSLTADKFKVHYQQIYSWTKKYERNGPEALQDHRGRKKPLEEMTPEEKLKVKMKELEAKNYRLEIENAFLKKLQELERRGF
jgi:transposase-like protein